MSTLEIVIVVVAALFLILVIGGAIVLRRRFAADADSFSVEVERANHDLAAAHASDNGWEEARLDAAARAAFEAERPGAPIDSLTLTQVIDPPGTDSDKAVYHVVSAGKQYDLTLGRRGDVWYFELLH